MPDGECQKHSRYLLDQQLRIETLRRLHQVLETQWLLVLQFARNHSAVGTRELHRSQRGTTLFYYEVHELEFDETEGRWASFEPDA